MLRVFNVPRCSILYTSSLHHNDCLMNGSPSNGESVILRARYYVALHLYQLCTLANSHLRSMRHLLELALHGFIISPFE
uniref:Uncharacterized protein n=1 Tax=Hyaloperonospora arabidopsidis (strain Emoy2) TaxID=559515 RepID=M4BEM8_HYAAE